MDENENFPKELANLLGPEAAEQIAEQIAEKGADIRGIIELTNARRRANGEPTLDEEAVEAMRDAALENDPEFSAQ